MKINGQNIPGKTFWAKAILITFGILVLTGVVLSGPQAWAIFGSLIGLGLVFWAIHVLITS